MGSISFFFGCIFFFFKSYFNPKIYVHTLCTHDCNCFVWPFFCWMAGWRFGLAWSVTHRHRVPVTVTIIARYRSLARRSFVCMFVHYKQTPNRRRANEDHHSVTIEPSTYYSLFMLLFVFFFLLHLYNYTMNKSHDNNNRDTILAVLPDCKWSKYTMVEILSLSKNHW